MSTSLAEAVATYCADTRNLEALPTTTKTTSINLGKVLLVQFHPRILAFLSLTVWMS